MIRAIWKEDKEKPASLDNGMLVRY